MAWVAVATVGGAALNYVGSQNAARSQTDAANRSQGINSAQYAQNRQDQAPYREAGLSALDRMMGRSSGSTINAEKKTALEERLKGIKAGQAHWTATSRGGLGGGQNQKNLDDHNADAADVQGQIDGLNSMQSQVQKTPAEIGQDIMSQDPGYQFRLDQGNKAINAAASARGGSMGGGALKDLTRFGQDYSSAEYGKAYDRLASMAGFGERSNNASAASGANYVNNSGQNYADIGNAEAAGAIGGANAISGGLASGANSFMQYNQMNKMFPGSGPSKQKLAQW